MKNLKIVLIFLFGFTIQINSQTYGTTDAGYPVVLYDDGTWEYTEREMDGEEVSDNIVVMPYPTFQETLAASSQKVALPKIIEISKKANDITDEMNWFVQNELALNEITGDPLILYLEDAGLPVYTAGALARKMIFSGNYNLIFYSDYELAIDLVAIYNQTTGETENIVDFSNYALATKFKEEDIEYVNQELTWAEIDGNLLYISNSHRTYAKSSFGENAYLTCINLDNLEVLWRSKPLVANSRNFIIYKDYIITGYGFTDEPDYLYFLNKFTGKQLSSTLLKSGPDYFLEKNGKLYVRTYNTDYVFEMK